MFKTISLLTALLLASHALLPAADATLPQAVDQAHTELWRRFVDPHGIIRDFVGELPTPEDCTPGRPVTARSKHSHSSLIQISGAKRFTAS